MLVGCKRRSDIPFAHEAIPHRSIAVPGGAMGLWHRRFGAGDVGLLSPWPRFRDLGLRLPGYHCVAVFDGQLRVIGHLFCHCRRVS